MSFGRASVLSLSTILCFSLLAALLPASAMAAPGGKAREYIVTLSVKDSGRIIKASNKASKQRIRQRAKAAREATDRVTGKHGVKARHRYAYAMTGFSAKMTAAEARDVASDPSVASVRVARRFKIAGEIVPYGIKRVKAWETGTVPSADVNANVAVLDTGIGPADSDGAPIDVGSSELNIAGGVNCYDATEPDGWYGDTQGHGTHVAGIIGARDNSVSTIGVAPGAKLWSVRVFKGSSGSETSVVCGLDWALATHSNGTPDIDVVNLSMEGPRFDYREGCDAILASAVQEGDEMRRAVCRVAKEGIVVVAAAGNSASNANDTVPGGYDEVITVGAITDTDGTGWENGSNAGCSGYTGEQDDTYASYSNFGSDVDIVAPGTCVASTDDDDPDGDPVFMSGTSMAAPHVTGAIARYIAENGNPGPAQMKQLVRAAGRMDWDPKTDPVYYGPNDSDPPNRVLDTKALTGSDALKLFVQHDSFKLSGGDPSETTRVDVQRGGGYAGTVNLSVPGLPAAAASATFGKASLNGLGANDLGTTLTFGLKPSSTDGVRAFDVRAAGSGMSYDRPFTLTIDKTGPKVTGLAPKIRGGVQIAKKGATQVYLQWNASDALGAVKSAQLQRKTPTVSWRNAGVGGNSTARVWFKPGQGNQFRVKAIDTAGNVAWSSAIAAKLTIRDSKSTQWTRPAGQWKHKKVKKAFGGSVLLAKGKTGSLTTTFSGKAVAIVASIGPARGVLRVRVDGGAWKNVKTKSGKAGHRKVVWIARIGGGSHTLEIQGLTGQAAIDALLIVR